MVVVTWYPPSMIAMPFDSASRRTTSTTYGAEAIPPLGAVTMGSAFAAAAAAAVTYCCCAMSESTRSRRSRARSAWRTGS